MEVVRVARIGYRRVSPMSGRAQSRSISRVLTIISIPAIKSQPEPRGHPPIPIDRLGRRRYHRHPGRPSLRHPQKLPLRVHPLFLLIQRRVIEKEQKVEILVFGTETHRLGPQVGGDHLQGAQHPRSQRYQLGLAGSVPRNQDPAVGLVGWSAGDGFGDHEVGSRAQFVQVSRAWCKGNNGVDRQAD
jgi:hypothetical protein